MTGRSGRRLANGKKKMQVKRTEKTEEKKAKTNRVSSQGGRAIESRKQASRGASRETSKQAGKQAKEASQESNLRKQAK